jgi:hypothetical protein
LDTIVQQKPLSGKTFALNAVFQPHGQARARMPQPGKYVIMVSVAPRSRFLSEACAQGACGKKGGAVNYAFTVARVTDKGGNLVNETLFSGNLLEGTREDFADSLPGGLIRTMSGDPRASIKLSFWVFNPEGVERDNIIHSLIKLVGIKLISVVYHGNERNGSDVWLSSRKYPKLVGVAAKIAATLASDVYQTPDEAVMEEIRAAYEAHGPQAMDHRLLLVDTNY